MAANAFGASAASAAISRDTVGSDATSPNTPGLARRTATSARQSPPTAIATATATARSSTTCRDHAGLVEMIVLHKAREDLVIHCMKARKAELDKALRITGGRR